MIYWSTCIKYNVPTKGAEALNYIYAYRPVDKYNGEAKWSMLVVCKNSQMDSDNIYHDGHYLVLLRIRCATMLL